jgi:hypothetical protein
VTGRASTIGPVDARLAASQDAITQAKRFERSAKEELEQHHRWLEDYIAAEARDKARHERRLWLMEVVPRRRLKRQLIVRRSKRTARKFAQRVHALALLLWQATSSTLSFLAQRLVLAGSWTGRQLRLFGRSLLAFTSASLAWAKINLALPLARRFAQGLTWAQVKGRALAQWLYVMSVAGLSWATSQTIGLARLLAKHLSIAFNWSRVHGRTFGLWLVETVTIGVASGSRQAGVLARSTAKQLSAALAWSRQKTCGAALSLHRFASIAYVIGVAKSRQLLDEFPRWAAERQRQLQPYRRKAIALAAMLSSRAGAGLESFKRSVDSMQLELKRRLAACASKVGPSKEKAEASASPHRADQPTAQRALVPLGLQSRALAPLTIYSSPWAATAARARAEANRPIAKKPRGKPGRHRKRKRA